MTLTFIALAYIGLGMAVVLGRPWERCIALAMIALLTGGLL